MCVQVRDGSSGAAGVGRVGDARQRLRRLRRPTELALHGRDPRGVRRAGRHEPVRAQPHHLLDAEPLQRRALTLHRPLLLGPQHLLPALVHPVPAARRRSLP